MARKLHMAAASHRAVVARQYLKVCLRMLSTAIIPAVSVALVRVVEDAAGIRRVLTTPIQQRVCCSGTRISGRRITARFRRRRGWIWAEDVDVVAVVEVVLVRCEVVGTEGEVGREEGGLGRRWWRRRHSSGDQGKREQEGRL